MPGCIYCEKKVPVVTFKRREHIVPKFMGTFENNLTLKGWVCDDCNSKVFNPLETKFKEDTEEGVYYQMFNLSNSCQVRIRGDNVKTTFSPGLGDDFFKQMFPFIKLQNNGCQILLLPQIKVKRYGDNGYLIFLVDELKKLGPKKFGEIKKLLEGVKSKDVSIITLGDDLNENLLQEAVEILKKLGIDYKEGQRKFAPIDKSEPPKQFEVSMDCTVGKEVGRVIAKIAFNYFSYCAIKENRSDILYHQNFASIKSYIVGELDLPIKQVIVRLDNEPIIFDEKIGNMRLVGHTLIFERENGNLVSRVSFLGKRIYTVILGPIPDELNRDDFGCGHLFDPINKGIHQLTQNPSKWGSGLPTGFGLYKRS